MVKGGERLRTRGGLRMRDDHVIPWAQVSGCWDSVGKETLWEPHREAIMTRSWGLYA